MVKVLISTLSLLLLTSNSYSVETGDILQAEGTLNARESAYFTGKSNISFILKKTDVAEIVEVVALPSGNKGLRIYVTAGPNKGKSAWIYYDSDNPSFDVFSKLKEDHQTEEEALEFISSQSALNNTADLEDYDRYLLELVKKEEGTVRVETAEETKPAPTVEPENQVFDEKSQSLVEKLIAMTKQSPVPSRTRRKVETCADCVDYSSEDTFSGMEFEKCTQANSQVQSKVAKSFRKSMEDHGNLLNTQDFSTITKCVQGGMEIGYGNAKYFNCSKERVLIAATPKKQGTKSRPYNPCRSKEMVGAVSSELYMATQCLDLDYKKMLPLLAHESRFFPNVSSATGAGGVGQLTGVCIEEVNRKFNEYVKKYSKRPGCHYLGEISKMHDGYQCARMSMPPNPRNNIVYAVIYQKMIRDNKALSPKISVNKWLKRRSAATSKRDKNAITEMLARIAYNSGPSATMKTFDTFAASPSNRNLDIKTFTEKFYKYYQRKVRAEGAKYNQKIIQETKLMETNAGVKCSESV